MPLINGCYFTKSELERDEKFLKAQGLSEEQSESVKAYFIQRLASTSLYSFLLAGPGTLLIVLGAAMLFVW